MESAVLPTPLMVLFNLFYIRVHCKSNCSPAFNSRFLYKKLASMLFAAEIEINKVFHNHCFQLKYPIKCGELNDSCFIHSLSASLRTYFLPDSGLKKRLR